jgi:hypothetical protein
MIETDSDHIWHLLTGQGRYYHLTPGRLRIEVPSTVDNPQACEALRQRWLNQPGIKSLQVSLRSGRVLFEFEPQVIGPERIAWSLLERDATQPIPLFSEGGVADWAAERLIKWALGLAFG